MIRLTAYLPGKHHSARFFSLVYLFIIYLVTYSRLCQLGKPRDHPAFAIPGRTYLNPMQPPELIGLQGYETFRLAVLELPGSRIGSRATPLPTKPKANRHQCTGYLYRVTDRLQIQVLLAERVLLRTPSALHFNSRSSVLGLELAVRPAHSQASRLAGYQAPCSLSSGLA